MRVLLGLVCLFSAFSSMGYGRFNSERYLENRICKINARRNTYIKALELMTERKARVLVETGTARYGLTYCNEDGCSTVIFSDWAKDHRAELYSVDINPDAIRQARRVVDPINPNVHFVKSDSIKFLQDFKGQIDFLYLDSYDFELDNPLPSQFHHLKEIEAAYPHLGPNSVVLVDDCDLPHGGKGKFVIQYLQSKGWRVVMAEYQVILVKN